MVCFSGDWAFDQKVIVITGATGTLGKAYCEAFAQLGAKLCITDIAEENLEVLATKLANDFGCDIVASASDVTDEQHLQRFFSKIETTFGHIDVLLNNAAATGEFLSSYGNAFAEFDDYPTDVWKHILDVNLTGPFLVTKNATKMFNKNGGSIINVSSIYGKSAPDHRIYEGLDFSCMAGYSASKAGVHGLTLWLSTYLAKRGIRVNTLVPGGVLNQQDAVFVKRYENRVPLQRMATSSDMLGAVLFLAGGASAYITGQQLVVDGGLTAW